MKKQAEKKKEDIKQNIEWLFKDETPIINVQVTLKGPQSPTHVPIDGELFPKKEKNEIIKMEQLKEELKEEELDADDKTHITKVIELDGSWPHVNVALIKQPNTDDDVQIVQSEIPVQTEEIVFIDQVNVKAEKTSVTTKRESFSVDSGNISTPSPKGCYESNMTSTFTSHTPIFGQSAFHNYRTSDSTSQKASTRTLGATNEGKEHSNYNYWSQWQGKHSSAHTYSSSEGTSRMFGQFPSFRTSTGKISDVSTSFPPLCQNDVSLQSASHFNAFLKQSNTLKDNVQLPPNYKRTERRNVTNDGCEVVSPIIQPSRLCHGPSPQLGIKNTPKPQVSLTKISQIGEKMKSAIKLSETSKHKKRSILRKKLRSAVVVPRGYKKVHRSLSTKSSKKHSTQKESSNKVESKGHKEETVNNSSPQKPTEVDNDKASENIVAEGKDTNKDFNLPTEAVDGLDAEDGLQNAVNQPKMSETIFPLEKAKSLLMGTSNIPNMEPKNSSPNEDVSNRSLSQIFNSKDNTCSSEDSCDPYKIFEKSSQSANLPSDLRSCSPLSFSCNDTIVEDSMNVIENTMELENRERDSKKSTSSANSHSEMIDLTNNDISSSVKENVNNNLEDAILLDSSEDKNDENSEQSLFPYVPLPGNKDTVMVDFSKRSNSGHSEGTNKNKDEIDDSKISLQADK